MAVEVRPLNVLCNIQCRYCYQDPQRDAGRVNREYDLTKIKAAIVAENEAFTLFGGEPLLMPLDDLEALWAFGYERFGVNHVQTNGTLITADHLRLFEQYNVKVGMSMDGPEELNDIRWHGTLERTRRSTAASQAALEALCRMGRAPSLIVTLHRMNATAEHLPRLLDWLREVARLGVTSARAHLLESESPEVRERFGLSNRENVAALKALLRLQRDQPTLKFDLFDEMQRLLVGDDRRTTCVWWACDPYTTRAVRGIEGQGQRSNCGRTNKDGVDFIKAPRPGFERYVALYHTDQADGGCRDCRFFLMCKGQCPGTAIDGDWRNRTEHCDVWKELFALLEAELLAEGTVPLSVSERRADVEQAAIGLWREGREVLIADLLRGSSADRRAQGHPQPVPIPLAIVAGSAS